MEQKYSSTLSLTSALYGGPSSAGHGRVELHLNPPSGPHQGSHYLYYMGVGGEHHAPATFLPGKTQYPLYRKLGGPQGWPGWVRKISPPTAHKSTSGFFDIQRTVHRDIFL